MSSQITFPPPKISHQPWELYLIDTGDDIFDITRYVISFSSVLQGTVMSAGHTCQCYTSLLNNVVEFSIEAAIGTAVAVKELVVPAASTIEVNDSKDRGGVTQLPSNTPGSLPPDGNKLMGACDDCIEFDLLTWKD
jgi:hypothetical protein